MAPLDLVKLTRLMSRTSGSPQVVVGLVDGRVVLDHPDLADQHLREIPGYASGACNQTSSPAWDFCRGDLERKKKLRCSGHLSQLHPIDTANCAC